MHPEGRVSAYHAHSIFPNKIQSIDDGFLPQASETIFVRRSYHEASDTSVVHCRPITGRSHQIRVHLQFLGHPIANDPVYSNKKAWGVENGKGGVFDDQAEVTAEQLEARAMRRRMGDKILAREKQKLKVKERKSEKIKIMQEPKEKSLSGEPTMQGEDGSAEIDGSRTMTERPSDDVSVSVFNRSGSVRTDLLVKEGIEDDREAQLMFQLEMSTGATAAIRALKDEKDKADGFARFRDMKGVELARAAGVSGNADSPFAPLANAPTGEESVINVPKTIFTDPLDLPDDIDREEKDDAFCSTCFLPVIGDPRPDQLFIWLHALRYKTIEWDWQSEEPYWSLNTYEPPRAFWSKQ